MRRNAIYIIVLAACVLISVFIAYKYIFSSVDSENNIAESEQLWVICNNPNCKAQYKMDKRSFYEEFNAIYDSVIGMNPGIKCKECGQSSCFEAIECPNCGNIFLKGASGANEMPDRCPECSVSATEQLRKARLIEGK